MTPTSSMNVASAWNASAAVITGVSPRLGDFILEGRSLKGLLGHDSRSPGPGTPVDAHTRRSPPVRSSVTPPITATIRSRRMATIRTSEPGCDPRMKITTHQDLRAPTRPCDHTD